MAPQQYILDFPVLHSHSTDDFVIGSCNKLAAEFVDLWPEWPSHALVIVGEGASGKTHLAKIFQEKSAATLIQGKDLVDADIPSFAASVVVENADQEPNEAALFHLFNWTRDNKGFLLLTAKTPPSSWGVGLRDLSSRLQSTQLVTLGQPGEDILGATMAKQFSDRQIIVDERVIAFLLKRIERSFSAVKTVVTKMDALSLREKSRITVPLARKVLENGEGANDV